MYRTTRLPLSFQTSRIASRAAEVAVHYRHPYIDHAHFLLAFLEVPNDAIQAILSKHLGSAPGLRESTVGFLESLHSLAEPSPRSLPHTKRMGAILDLAQDEAIRRDAPSISPGHLFLALATEDLMTEAERGSVSSRLLAPTGLALIDIRGLLFPTSKLPTSPHDD